MMGGAGEAIGWLVQWGMCAAFWLCVYSCALSLRERARRRRNREYRKTIEDAFGSPTARVTGGNS